MSDLSVSDDELRDPIQGMDVLVRVLLGTSAKKDGTDGGLLVGGFTDLMFKVVNQTEAYIALNTRWPRMLDGEVIVVWTLARGVISLDVIGQTFGTAFANAFAQGRKKKLPRSRRFDISFSTLIADEDFTNDDTTFRNATSIGGFDKYRIKYCRVDTLTFGVTSGKHVAQNAWTGTGQFIVPDNVAVGTSSSSASTGTQTSGGGTAA